MTDRTNAAELVTDELVEKAAKAQYEAWVQRDSERREFSPRWQDLGDPRELWIDEARAALEAVAGDIAAKALDEVRSTIGAYIEGGVDAFDAAVACIEHARAAQMESGR